MTGTAGSWLILIVMAVAVVTMLVAIAGRTRLVVWSFGIICVVASVGLIVDLAVLLVTS